MITEWQPILPEDELKFKARTLIEFLKEDGSKFLVVGQGMDKKVAGSALTIDNVVAWREFDCLADACRERPPLKANQK